MKIRVTDNYLWLPVNKKNEKKKLHFIADGKKFQEIDIELGGKEQDFYVSMDVAEYIGQEIEITGEAGKEELTSILCKKEKVKNEYPFRPKLHFSPEIGWMNDPNGLVYQDGEYHLFYQWNPYGTQWGNMHWGHAVSRDLVHWEYLESVLAPGKQGTIFSGCGWADRENRAGFGKDTLLFYYTAAGGTNQWSKEAGNLFTQRLAYSKDNGRTLYLSDKFLLENVIKENRDPKICYHEESQGYIMVLYLNDNDFAIYRSDDLLHWTMTQKLTCDGMWECPNLFALPVDGEDKNQKYIFWSADGYYLVGSFDGYTFLAETEKKAAYINALPYAAQTYAGITDRIIHIAWLKMQNDRGNYCGLMSLPMELSLKKAVSKDKEDYQLCFTLAKELKQWKEPKPSVWERKQKIQIPLKNRPLEIQLERKKDSQGQIKIRVGNSTWIIDNGNKEISLYKKQMNSDSNQLLEAGVDETSMRQENSCLIEKIPFAKEEGQIIRLIIDQEVMECLIDDGTLYGAFETEENILQGDICVEGETAIDKVLCYEYQI